MSAAPVVRLIECGARGLGGYGSVRILRGFRLLHAIEPDETRRAVKSARSELHRIGGPVLPDGRMRRGTTGRPIFARGLRELRHRGSADPDRHQVAKAVAGLRQIKAALTREVRRG